MYEQCSLKISFAPSCKWFFGFSFTKKINEEIIFIGNNRTFNNDMGNMQELFDLHLKELSKKKKNFDNSKSIVNLGEKEGETAENTSKEIIIKEHD